MENATKSKYTIKPWSIAFALLILTLFLTFYAYIYDQHMKTPSDNWSNPILFDERTSSWDYEKIKATDTIALPYGDDTFLNMSLQDNTLTIGKYDIYGKALDTNAIDIGIPLTSINGSIEDGILKLYLYSDSKQLVKIYAINLDTNKLISTKDYNTEGHRVNLMNDHFSLYNDSEIRIINFEKEIIVKNTLKSSIINAATVITGDDFMATAALNFKANQVISNIASTDSPIIDSYIFKVPAYNTMNISSISIVPGDDKSSILISANDVKYGISFLHSLELNDKYELLSNSQQELDSYETIPYIANTTKGPRYLINMSVATLGRTEISRDTVAYPNIFMSDGIDEDEYTQLTKSQLSCIKPSFIEVGEHEYLIYKEQDGNTLKSYISSNNPDIISYSKKTSLATILEIFFRVIVHYPAIIFSTMFLAVYVLLPTCFIIMPLFMFKIELFERKSEKIVALILLLHNIFKIYVYNNSIFNNAKVFASLPKYLQPAWSHWGFMIVISLLTFSVIYCRVKERKITNNYYKYIAYYLLLDAFAMNLFFGPYIVL